MSIPDGVLGLFAGPLPDLFSGLAGGLAETGLKKGSGREAVVLAV